MNIRNIVIIFGEIMLNSQNELELWDAVLSTACRFQNLFNEKPILVGGTAVAIYTNNRISYDNDHILNNLKEHYQEVLDTLDNVVGWKTNRIQKPVLILGSLDGIETGIRQLRRTEPLEKRNYILKQGSIVLLTEAELLRIKGFLILMRNATRDYLDFLAMVDYLGIEKSLNALLNFDKLYQDVYSKENSALFQLTLQLSKLMPYDINDISLQEYKLLKDKWQNLDNLKKFANNFSFCLFTKNICKNYEIKETQQNIIISKNFIFKIK